MNEQSKDNEAGVNEVKKALERFYHDKPELKEALEPKTKNRPKDEKSYRMIIMNDTAYQLKLSRCYGVEVDYSANPLSPGQGAYATFYESWEPPCAFYMVFRDVDDSSVWGGIIGIIYEDHHYTVEQVINGKGLVNHVSKDLKVDELLSS